MDKHPEPDVSEVEQEPVAATPAPTHQEVADAIAYFRATSNRHDLTDILTAALGSGPDPEVEEPDGKEPSDKKTIAQTLKLKR